MSKLEMKKNKNNKIYKKIVIEIMKCLLKMKRLNKMKMKKCNQFMKILIIIIRLELIFK